MAIVIASTAAPGFGETPAPGSTQRAPVAPVTPIAFARGHVLVQLAPGVSVAADGRALRIPAGFRAERDAARALAEAGAAAIRPIFLEPPRDAALAARLGLDRWRRVELAPGADARAAVARLAKSRAAFSDVSLDGEGGLAEIPNDANFGLQYSFRNVGQTVGGSVGVPGADVRATSAWDFTHGDPDLVIAVLDSGIDPHPELAGRILPGINVPDGNTSTADECNHGTHVAGILAATGNNGTGVAGMTWNAKLLPVVVVNGCTGFESNVASGLTWAVDQGARLVNMSLQFYLGSALFQQAVQYAHAQGALMVAATGNNGNTTIAAPARWNETIAVGATDHRDLRWSGSNYGAETDLVAPGFSVWSLSSGGGGYVSKTGTSMAVPHVTGAAALLRSYNPALTRDEIRALLVSTARDLGTPGSDVFFGAGCLNAGAALAATPAPPGIPEDLNDDGVVNAEDLAILLAAWGDCVDCDGGCVADVDGDCTVGALDLARLLAAW